MLWGPLSQSKGRNLPLVADIDSSLFTAANKMALPSRREIADAVDFLRCHILSKDDEHVLVLCRAATSTKLSSFVCIHPYLS